MQSLSIFKNHFFRVIRAYPLGFVVLSAYFGYMLLAILIDISGALRLFWSYFFVFVFFFSLVVDFFTHKIHIRDRITSIGIGAILVVLVSLVVYYMIFRHGFCVTISEGITYSQRYIYYYLGMNAMVLGVFVCVVLQDLEKFINFVEHLCVNVLLWLLGLGLLGLMYASVEILDLHKMILWGIPIQIILLLYAYGLFVRFLSFLATLQGKSTLVASPSPLARIVLWVFNIFAFMYVALLILYAYSPQKYFDGVVHLVLWFGIFLILLAWSNILSGKSKMCFMFLAIAFVLESVAIWAIGVRIGEYGFTPNRIFVLLAGVFFAFVAISHIVLESKIIESKHKSQDLLRTISVAFILFFGIGGIATPSVSIHSQLHHLESLKNILDNPRTRDAKTQEEINELISAYNSVLSFLEDFGQGDNKKYLNSWDYLSNKSKQPESTQDMYAVQYTTKRYEFDFWQAFGLHSYIDVMFDIPGLKEVCVGDSLISNNQNGYFYYDTYAFRICEDTLRVYDVIEIKGKANHKLLLEVPHLSQKIIETHSEYNKILSFTNKNRTFGLMLVLKDMILKSEYDPKTKIGKQWIGDLEATALITTQ